MTADQIPDAIEDVPDSITKEIIECENAKQAKPRTEQACSGTGAYRIIPMELAFLRLEKIPIPRQCIDCRHNERISQRAKAFLYHRQCQCAGPASSNGIYTNFAPHPKHGSGLCPNEFETAYPSNDPRIIYCHDCFFAEVA